MDIHKEIKSSIENKVVKNIDVYLNKIGIVIKKDIGKNKNKLGILNYIGWVIIILFIFLDVIAIISYLYQIGIISTIDESKIDDIIQEEKNKDLLVELATAYGDTSSYLLDEIMAKNYTILRCSKKRLCCLVSIVLRIFQSLVSIIFLIYIAMKHRVFYGIIFMIIFYISIGILIYFSGIQDDLRYIMCPMPNEYRKLFEFE